MLSSERRDDVSGDGEEWRDRMSVAGLSLLTATRRGMRWMLWDLQVWEMRVFMLAMFWRRVEAREGSSLRVGGGIDESVEEWLVSEVEFEVMIGRRKTECCSIKLYVW